MENDYPIDAEMTAIFNEVSNSYIAQFGVAPVYTYKFFIDKEKTCQRVINGHFVLSKKIYDFVRKKNKQIELLEKRIKELESQ